MRKILITILIGIAVLPLIGNISTSDNTRAIQFPGWPQDFEGSPLTRLPLTDLEKIFERNFPGKIGRFTDGKREIIFRWVQAPTRKMHPSHHCFRGAGYSVTFLPIEKDGNGLLWNSFAASKNDKSYKIKERVFETGFQQGWTDIPTWYWKAIFGKSKGPWWAITIAETQSL